ncbi:transposable element Tcb2 transposase [Trichonephila clavipes]|nr:transposable element Tcb2 transposase [Trichonephila clavipes]
MINGRTRLHVVANGTMTGQRYIDEALLPHVRLFRGAAGDKFVFMDDNATCHRTLAVQDCLDSEGIQRLLSTDLTCIAALHGRSLVVLGSNSCPGKPRSDTYTTRLPRPSIENVWDALGRQVAGRNYPPTNKNTLIRALTEEWDKLPQQLLDNVVQSMNRTTINIRRVADLLVRLEEGEKRWEVSDHPHYRGGTKPNCTVACMVPKATDNDRRLALAPCHDEFRGPQSDVTVGWVG